MKKGDKDYQLKEIEEALNSLQEEKGLDASSVYEPRPPYLNIFSDKLLLTQAIRKGISYSLFDQIKKASPFSESDWAQFLNISEKTLQRNKKEKVFRFKPIHSEKILELTEVTKAGLEIFDSSDQFRLWLQSVSPALGNSKPAELLQDSYGKELVMDELNRIEHGIFA